MASSPPDGIPLASTPTSTPRTPNRSRAIRNQALATSRRNKYDVQNNIVPTFVHGDYANWRQIWRAIRHAMIGEVEIKRHAALYLPRMESMDDAQWGAYLERAVFYNMVYRTVTGLTGNIFRRESRLFKAGPRLTKNVKRVSKDGLSLNVFSKVVAQELLSVGRYGVLLDKADSQDPTVQPFFAGYSCENLLDWTETEIEGRNEADYILLREFKTDRRFVIAGAGDALVPNPTYGQFFIRYRALRLLFNEEMQRWEYHQELYERENADANLSEEPTIIKPMLYGVPWKRIPFRFFNSTTGLSDVEKPPILDILTLNLSHYRTYAQLEHGRFFTANPVYYVSGGNDDDDYHIGPSVVWQIEAGQQAGLIEFNGQGLKSLETGLKSKEDQVASLGGRLLGESANAGQSDNQVKIKDRNEQSLLLNVTTVINEQFTDLLQLMALWLNEHPWDEVKFRVNQDFLLNNAAAREFRAVTMMYQEGILPIDVVYEYFLKAEVIPEYVDQDTFKNLLDNPDQFPNNANIEARHEGFGNAAARDMANLQDDEQAFELEMAGNEQAAAIELAQENGKNAVKVAVETAKIPAVPPAATQANVRDPAGAPPKGQPKPAPAPKTPAPKPAAPSGNKVPNVAKVNKMPPNTKGSVKK